MSNLFRENESKLTYDMLSIGFTLEAASNSKQEHWWWSCCCTCRTRQGGNGDGHSKARI